jgi:hypothetical protein
MVSYLSHRWYVLIRTYLVVCDSTILYIFNQTLLESTRIDWLSLRIQGLGSIHWAVLRERKIEPCTLGDAERFQLVMLISCVDLLNEDSMNSGNAQRLSWAWWKLRLLYIPSLLFSNDFLKSFIPGGFFAQWLFDHIQHIVVQCQHILAGRGYHMGSLCIIPEDTSSATYIWDVLLCSCVLQICCHHSWEWHLALMEVMPCSVPGITVLFTDLENWVSASHAQLCVYFKYWLS